MKIFKRTYKRIRKYIFNQSVSIKDRSFVLFSILVLIALFVAVPCGLIMHEPPMATISTLLGAILFSIYVQYSIKRKQIARAKIVLSLVLVFIFLPAMFFTNGGAPGGAPIWMLLGMIYISLILDGRFKAVMLTINIIVLTICWIIGYLYPGLVTEFSRGGNYFDSLAALFIVGSIEYGLISFHLQLSRRDEENKNLKRLFEQTATALANAIDAKDNYTHGHSSRVAEYSKKIAALAGKSPFECDEIYYVALLHDVGKIGVPEHIINKEGRLTDEEYNIIKQHPVFGAQILHSVSEYPNLIVGAKYHHERYDGKGYPDKLKGEDIPEIARIISVADAYDAMTSKRSYRDTIPQQSVREEIVKGSGTQFDPKFAKIMQHLIDMDTEYEMKEKDSVQELSGKSDLKCAFLRDEISAGILLGNHIKNISLKCEPLNPLSGDSLPAMILFDSLDGRYHVRERDRKDLNYFEYAQIGLDGQFECEGARKIAYAEEKKTSYDNPFEKTGSRIYNIQAVKYKDHALITIDDSYKTITLTIALPDSSRFLYIGLTGQNCHLYDVKISTAEEEIGEGYINRIAEEVSFINGPEGDLPNIQMDGYRTNSSPAIPIRDGLTITFHTMSLPTAHLVWHCAYVDLYYSEDKKPFGEGYKEYAFIRIDGENWETEGIAENRQIVNIGEDFEGWDVWKEYNKKGFDCTITFKRIDNRIITYTENFGVAIRNTTTILDDPPQIYASLTGDQCAITNIRIKG